MSRFKVGDKVKVCTTVKYFQSVKNEIGIIFRCINTKTWPYDVKFNNTKFIFHANESEIEKAGEEQLLFSFINKK